MADDEMVDLHEQTPGAIDAVIEYLTSATDADKAALIERHPVLLTDEADDILRQIEEAHRKRGDEATAMGVDGTRFALRRRRLYGADHAALEQAILAAFTQFEPSGPKLATLVSRYPELLRPESDRAFDELRKEFDGELDWFLDLLQEAVREGRVAATALDEGNPVPSRPPPAGGTLEPEMAISGPKQVEAFAKAIEAGDFGATQEQVTAALAAMSGANSVEDVRKVHESQPLSRDPAFLEYLSLAREECPVSEPALLIFWQAAEFAAPKTPPNGLKEPYEAWDRGLESGAANDVASRGEKIVEDDAFKSGSEYFQLEVLIKTGLACLQLYEENGAADLLNTANRLLSEACRKSRTGSPSFAVATTYGGHSMLLKYQLTGSQVDLQTAILVLSSAVANHMNHIPSLLPLSGLDLVEAHLLSFDKARDEHALTSAGETFSYTLGWSRLSLERNEWPDVGRSQQLFSELSSRLSEADQVAILQDVTASAEAFLDAHDQ